MKRLIVTLLLVTLFFGCSDDGDNPTGATVQTITDIDGNVYHSVVIGTQTWMVENLMTTHYNDGTPIPLVTDSASWGKLTTPGYCWYYNNPTAYKNTYGALYNWYAVGTGKLAPKGWHVPSDSEWTVLTTYLGGEKIAGAKMKEAGSAHWHGSWLGPNEGTNSSGFTAMPAGVRNTKGAFVSMGDGCSWWTSTELTYGIVVLRVIHVDGPKEIARDGYVKYIGNSVRCLKD